MQGGAKVLVNNFKFGFELEAFVTERAEDSKHDDLDTYEAAYARVEAYIKQFFKVEDGCIDSDGSLEPSARGGFEFEWPSPVLDFTPANIAKCVRFLEGLKGMGVYVNKTCGFHVHISFPQMTLNDIRWLVFQIAMDEKVENMISKFHGKNFFTDYYANNDFLERIRREVNNPRADLETKIKNVRAYLTDEKYRNVRIHPQGTLEWRGPRQFLNRRKKGITKDFFKLLWQFNRWIAKATTNKVVAGISKEALFEGDSAFWYERHRKLIEDLNNNPTIINKLNHETSLFLISQHPSYYLNYYNKPLSDELQRGLVDRLSSYDFGVNYEKFSREHQVNAVYRRAALLGYTQVGRDHFKTDEYQLPLAEKCIAGDSHGSLYVLYGRMEIPITYEVTKLLHKHKPNWLTELCGYQRRRIHRYLEQIAVEKATATCQAALSEIEQKMAA